MLRRTFFARFRPRRLAWAGALLVLALVPSICLGDTVHAAGDGDDLWVVLGNNSSALTILHRRELDEPQRLELAAERQGQLAPTGIAAAGGRLWLVYRDFTVQSISAFHKARPGQPRFSEPHLDPALPSVSRLWSLAANNDAPWALVRADKPDVLAQIDGPRPSSLPSDEDAPPTPPAAPALSTAPASQPQTRPFPAEDRLLRLERNHWVKVDLPSDWPREGGGWLVMLRPNDPAPILLSLQPVRERGELVVYRREGDAWARQGFPVDAGGTLLPVAVDGQLVLGRMVSSAGGTSAPNEVELSVPWTNGVAQLGRIDVIEEPALGSWPLAQAGQTAALIQTDAQKKLIWTRMDLSGNPVGARSELVLWSDQAPAITQFIQIGILIVAFLTMFFVWRRDPVLNQPRLPRTLVTADLFRRASAAAIDALPCLFLVSLVSGVSVADLVNPFPGANEILIPYLGVRVVLAVYMCLAELFTGGRTLGKAALGLRAAGLAGEPPQAWQVVSRNLFKALELTAFPLLLLPVIRPHAQRLGDLVARTLVVAPRPPEGAGGEGGTGPGAGDGE